MRRFTWLALIAITAGLVLAPLASADDNSVYQAWIAHNGEFAKQESAVKKNTKSKRSRRAKAKRLIEIVDQMRKTLANNTSGVKAQEPSSADGAAAKNFVLKSNARVDLSFLSTRKAMRLLLDGASDRKINRYIDRAVGYIDQAKRYDKKALAAFRGAGLDV